MILQLSYDHWTVVLTGDLFRNAPVFSTTLLPGPGPDFEPVKPGLQGAGGRGHKGNRVGSIQYTYTHACVHVCIYIHI